MTRAVADPTADSGTGVALAGPVPAPRTIGQRRVRYGHLGLAVAMVALGGLLAGFAFLTAGRTHAYLAVARPVEVGTKLTAADLTTVRLAATPGLSVLSAGEEDRVIGHRAAVRLVTGTLLSARQLTDAPIAGPGQRQVGVGLKPDRMPARELRPGDPVQLVATPDPNTVGDARSDLDTPAESFDGVVVDASVAPNESSVVVYVTVDDGDGARIATLAAAGRITMTLTGPR
jgi:hypothetical protein